MKNVKVAAAIICDESRVLATQRGYGEFKDMWEFPGGKIEINETPEEALKREVMEELDIKVRIEEPFCAVEYDYPTFHLSMSCFICSIVEGKLTLKEHESAKWLSAEELDIVEWLPADAEIIPLLREKLSTI